MALSKNTLLTGKRVYNGASLSPNKGRVSAKGAQGYMKREIRSMGSPTKKSRRLANSPKSIMRGHGGSGPRPMAHKASQSRSQIAAIALQRMKNNNKKKSM